MRRFHPIAMIRDLPRFYKRSLAIALLIASIPAVIIGLGFYTFGTRQIEREVLQTHRNELSMVRDRIDEQLAHLEKTASQWSFNPIFSEKLRTIDDLYRQFLETQEFYGALFTIKGSSPLLGQVYLYVDSQRALVTEDHGVRKLPERETYFAELLRRENRMFWENSSTSPYIAPISLVHLLPGNGQKRHGALIMTLNQAKLDELVNGPAILRGGRSFLIDKSGDWVTSPPGGDSAFPLDELRREVLRREAPTESFTLAAAGRQMIVTYGTIVHADSQWIYVTGMPLDKLTTPVLVLSRTILLVSGLGLLAALLLTWFGSNQLYKPVYRLVQLFRTSAQGAPADGADEIEFIARQWGHALQDSRHLRERLNQQLPALREGFLIQLMQGHLYSFTEAELREKMTNYGWRLEGRRFAPLIVQLVGFFDAMGKFKESDKQLITFAASNIIEEVAREKFDTVAVINFQDLSIGVLVGLPAETAWRGMKRELFQLSDEMTDMLNKLLKLSVVISIGKSADMVKDIPEAVNQLKQTLRYRLPGSGNQILDVDEMMPDPSSGFHYPFSVEKDILSAIRRGEEEEAGHLVGQFLEALGEHRASEYDVQHSVLYLLGSIHQAIIQIGFNPGQIYGGTHLYEALCMKREPAEILSWFKSEVIRPYIAALAETKDSQMKTMVDQTLELIHTAFDGNISLEYCADQLGVHPVRLSKAFKQMTGFTFIDYLTKVRIDKSKELLSTTDWKISEIAHHVGYQASYFNRIFRKHEGMTASEYRNQFS